MSEENIQLEKEVEDNAHFGEAVDLLEGDNIRVYLRIRPFIERETSTGCSLKPCLTVNKMPDSSEAQSVTLMTQPRKSFTFDDVGPPDTSQEEVFRGVGKSMVDTCIGGYNGTIFAYGQTGSGKTFTMEGEQSAHHLRGMIPRIFEYLFSLMKRLERKSGGRTTFLCKASFLEIYNEQIFDLLEPDRGAQLALREDIQRGPYVEALTEEVVGTPEHAQCLLDTGSRNRRVGETSMNRESSRSHSVFTLVVQSKEETNDGVVNVRTARLNLIDLAGSERQSDTSATGKRLAEAGNINKSLSALGNVINALVDVGQGRVRHVHYRDSKLTFLLKDSLGGNTKTYIIACVSPSDRSMFETMSTLKFARRAKAIKNNAVINEDTKGSIEQLQAQIKMLKAQLERVKDIDVDGVDGSRGGEGGLGDIGIAPGPYPPQTPVQYHRTPRTRTHTRSRSLRFGLSMATGDDPHSYSAATVSELETLLATTLEQLQTEQRRSVKSAEKLTVANTLVQKKDKALNNAKMILGFRDSALKRSSASGGKKTIDSQEQDTQDTQAKTIQELREEINVLNDHIENHPDVTRFALENLQLRERLEEYEKQYGSDHSHEMSEVLRLKKICAGVTEQIERILGEKKVLEQKLDDALSQTLAIGEGEGEGEDEDEDGQHTPTPHTPHTLLSPQKRQLETVELEKWRATQDFETQLHAIQSELAEEREQRTKIEEMSAARIEQLTKELESKEQRVRDLEAMNSALEASSESQKRQLKVKEEQVSLLTQTKDETAGESKVLERKLISVQSTLDTTIAEYEKKLEDHKSTIHSLRSEVKVSDDRYSAHLMKLNALKSVNTTLQTSIDELTVKLNTTQAQCDKLSKEKEKIYSDMQNGVSAFENEVSSRDEQIESLRVQVNECESRAREAEEEKESLEMEVQFNVGKVAESSAAIAQYESEIESLKNTLCELEEEVKEREKSEGSVDEEVNRLRVQIADLTAENEEVRNEVKSLQKTQASKEKTYVKLNSKYSDLLASFNEMRPKLRKKDIVIASFEVQLEDLEEQVSIHRREVEALKEIEAKYDALVLDRVELERTHDSKIAELMREVERVSDEGKERLEAEKEAEECRLNSIKSKFDIERVNYEEKMDVLSHTIQTLEGQLQSKDSEIAAMEAAKKVKEEEEEEKERQHEEAKRTLQSEITTLTITIDDLKKQNAKQIHLLNRGQSIESALSEAQLQLLDQSKMIARQNSELETLEYKYGEVSARLDKVRAERDALETEVKTEKARVVELDGRVEEFIEIGHRYEEKIPQLERELAEANMKCENLEAERDLLSTKLDDLNILAVKAQRNVEERVRENQQLKAQCDIDVSSMNEEMTKAVNEATKYKRDLSKALSDRDEWLSEMERLRKEEEKSFEESELNKMKAVELSDRCGKLEADLQLMSIELKRLEKENAKLVGHQNQRQKIQYHLKVKEENTRLSREKATLEENLRVKSSTVIRLESELKKYRAQLGLDANYRSEWSTQDELSEQLKESEESREAIQNELHTLVSDIKQSASKRFGHIVNTEGVGEGELHKSTHMHSQTLLLVHLFDEMLKQLESRERKINSLEQDMSVMERRARLAQLKADLAPETETEAE